MRNNKLDLFNWINTWQDADLLNQEYNTKHAVEDQLIYIATNTKARTVCERAGK